MESAPVLVRHAGGVAALRQLPPGFRFRPTDEELVVQYLRRKAFGVPLPAAVIPVVRDLYSLDPWDIPAAADASEGEKYFFAVRPAGVGGGCSKSGARAAPATASGRWKPAGKEKPVVLPRPCGGGSLLVGVKRAMTFAPRRKKKASSAALAAGWVMHEYRLAAPLHKNGCSLAQAQGEWVVCRVFQTQRSSNRPRRRATPAGHAASPSSSTASCVTDGSDQEEVSS
ncbi:NAC domain-containing protein 18-like [Panicum miliaceum]|uniref:NAC domain-containing protein 18-like n=1 Tax=Panicum miliaceum TaxID=4540 RepID=A0A3L6RHL2_PANMI|nr:NAC domain-containing protein 18-like [Panicum miliaceum]